MSSNDLQPDELTQTMNTNINNQDVTKESSSPTRIPDLDSNKQSTYVSTKDYGISLLTESDINKPLSADSTEDHGISLPNKSQPDVTTETSTFEMPNSYFNKQATTVSTEYHVNSLPTDQTQQTTTSEPSTSQVPDSYDTTVSSHDSPIISTTKVTTSNQEPDLVRITSDNEAKKGTSLTQLINKLIWSKNKKTKKSTSLTTKMDFNDSETKKDDPTNAPIPDQETTKDNPIDKPSPDQDRIHLLYLISEELALLKEICPKLGRLQQKITKEIGKAVEQFLKLQEADHCDPYELKDLKRSITKLKLQIPAKHRTYDDKDQQKNQKLFLDNRISTQLPKKLPRLHDKLFHQSIFSKTMQHRYNDLRLELKLCLLCFSVFPENEEISRRLMVYWWMAEGLILGEDDARKTVEDYANEFFIQLMEKNFIEPVSRSPDRYVATCKMQPMIRAALVMISDRIKFLDFDEFGSPKDFGKADSKDDNIWQSHRVCLMGTGLSKGLSWEKLHMLFNVKDDILEFKPEWFLKMQNINLLILGRWQSSAARHIEVVEFKIKESLEYMKHVRFFSLQGVSRITELPESISKLESLLILDLRACHNLEKIPKTIGLLKYLTHLDMSECYLLKDTPKEISSLVFLEVLKGFVVVDSQQKHVCNLEDLVKLERLRKLSMYTHMKDFPKESHLHALQKLEGLRKLTILWGGSESKPTKQQTKQDNVALPIISNMYPRKRRVEGSMKRMNAFNNSTFGSRLEKLDLKCFPDKRTPSWLTPGSLKGLKKLYILGGEFSNIGQYQDIYECDDSLDIPKVETWNVKVLRLKYLDKLKLNWRELQNLFPEMTYFEKVNCPRLAMFPCNEHGVWEPSASG